jgi:hypothetical protein
MNRFYNILSGITSQIQSNKIESSSKFKPGDLVTNINPACIHYQSEGIVENFEYLRDNMGLVVSYKTTNSGTNWKQGDILKKTSDQLMSASIQVTSPREPSVVMDGPETTNDLIAYTEETDMVEYKEEFYEMSVGSLRAIATHATEILNSLENPRVKENLTESWLQGKIAVTEDYMRTIHDFIMYVAEATDTISAADRPGLWENIRRKKERMGKKYKPAQVGDKDRPDSKQWKKLQKPD